MCSCKPNKIKQPAKKVIQKSKSKTVSKDIVTKFYYNE